MFQFDVAVLQMKSDFKMRRQINISTSTSNVIQSTYHPVIVRQRSFGRADEYICKTAVRTAGRLTANIVG